jgi:hypothetical protein
MFFWQYRCNSVKSLTFVICPSTTLRKRKAEVLFNNLDAYRLMMGIHRCASLKITEFYGTEIFDLDN